MKISGKTKSIINTVFLFTDSIVFSALILLLFNPVFRILKNGNIALIAYLALSSAVVLIRFRLRSDRQKMQNAQKEEQRRTERILLYSDEALCEAFGKKRFMLIRKACPDRFDAMEAIRRGADAVGVFAQNKEFMEIIRIYSPETVVYDPYAMTDVLFEKKHKTTERKGERQTKRRIRDRLNKYLILGMIFMIASFILNSKIYYRLIASICLILATVSGILDNRRSRNNFLIFLDKRDD